MHVALNDSATLDQEYSCAVSLAELQEQVHRLTPDERLQLMAYLRQLEQINDPAWRAEMDRRMERMDRGEKFRAADLDKIDAADA